MRFDAFFRRDCTTFDFDALLDRFPWARAMAATPQDPLYHAEGDVWTHTRMVCDELVCDPQWSALNSAGRRLMLIAALLHDAGKPEVTVTDEDGRIRSPEHSIRGATLARRILWEMEEPFSFREEVVTLVRNHMQPRYLPEQSDARRRTFAISMRTRCDWLALLARADTRGRHTSRGTNALDRIEEFTEFCRRHECLSRPRRFSSDHARFLYFTHRIDDPDAEVEPPAGPRMTIMSGLPGSGKDTWITRHADGLAVVALDQIRMELGVEPASRNQKAVTRLARERAVQLLAARQDFVWNATTLNRSHRRTLLDLSAPYDPRVRIVHVDAPPSLLFPGNRARPAHAVVPDEVIWRMTGYWNPPDLTEAHELVISTPD